MIPNKSKKIYLSCYPSSQAIEVKNNLINLYNLSDKFHELTTNPEAADLILIGQPGNELKGNDYLREITNNSLIDTYPEKSFAVSFFRANHLFLTRGIYESGIKSFLLKNRIRSGCYIPDSFNPVIKKIIKEKRSVNKLKKKFLFSFVGRNSHKIRANIFLIKFSRKDVHIEDTSSFNVWDESISDDHWRFEHYKDVLLKSKFSLCPRGFGPGSIRVFESMSLGVSPVVISDEWKLPIGPKWENFSIVIKKKDLVHLESIISSYEDKFEVMGREAKKAYEKYFSEHNYFNYVISECSQIVNSSIIPEKIHWNLRTFYVKYFLSANWLKTRKNKLYRLIFLFLKKMQKLLMIK